MGRASFVGSKALPCSFVSVGFVHCVKPAQYYVVGAVRLLWLSVRLPWAPKRRTSPWNLIIGVRVWTLRAKATHNIHATCWICTAVHEHCQTSGHRTHTYTHTGNHKSWGKLPRRGSQHSHNRRLKIVCHKSHQISTVICYRVRVSKFTPMGLGYNFLWDMYWKT